MGEGVEDSCVVKHKIFTITIIIFTQYEFYCKVNNKLTMHFILGTGQRILVCFSFISNFRRLLSASKGSEELKALHGLKALSMAYVILGHTYVWINFQLLRK